MVVVGTVLGGTGAATWYLNSADADSTPPPPPAPTAQSAEEVARAVVDRLNAKDLPGVIELTCAQGKATGRRELVTAFPTGPGRPTRRPKRPDPVHPG
ncbi:hypothetical protein GCM10029964_045360 [Kibdelosporangium lantanae]